MPRARLQCELWAYVVYSVSFGRARAAALQREKNENRNRDSETVHLKHGVHRNVYAVTYSRTAARRAQPEMHYCELSTCWQSRASPTADQERQHGPPHSSRTPKGPEQCPPSASTRRCLWWLSGQVQGRCCRVERVSRVAQRHGCPSICANPTISRALQSSRLSCPGSPPCQCCSALWQIPARPSRRAPNS